MYALALSITILRFAFVVLSAPGSSQHSKWTNTVRAAASGASISRTTAPDGCLEVGSGKTYSTIQNAVDALDPSASSACIFINSGTYEEQVTIDYAGALTLYGSTNDTSSYDNNSVTITHTITSSAAGTLDKSSTVHITSDNTYLYNINIANGYGKGSQAVAVTTDDSKLAFHACQFSGYQDTLYVKSGTQYYESCLIEGAVDYIFGGASAWFDSCTIMSNGPGAITASGRETDDATWYVFDKSTITAAAGTDLSGQVYLGRPWRVDARVMYQNSQLSEMINAKGWTTMAENATPLYYEFQNTGDGSDTSQRQYETASNAAIDIGTVLGSDYSSWIGLASTSNSTVASR
ncbi:MAG: hypothetical protein Q9227_002814 [Pyrenula ochraceoflavens]